MRESTSMALPSLLALALVFLLRTSLAVAVETKDDSLNVSSISWATSMHSDLVRNHPYSTIEDTDLEDYDADGGFSSLDSMLQWAIGHSDPAALKGAAQAVQNLSDAELGARQAAIKELMESLRMPSDADLMKKAIANLHNYSSSFEDRQRALEELLELVEPIYNSNDLHKLGGLVVVVRELNRTEQDLRILAAWVLGKASQNNEVVQNQLLDLGVIPMLMKMVRSRSAEEAVKALYALSAVIRNHPAGQEDFYLLEGMSLLEDLLRNTTSDERLRRKSLFLVADLAEQQKELVGVLSQYEPSKNFLMAVVSLVEAEDLDTQEKALMAIRSLSGISERAHRLLKEECDIESALLKMLVQLDVSIKSDDHSEFAQDLQVLCQKVRSMFLDKEDPSTPSQ